jgi:hypothetical protein
LQITLFDRDTTSQLPRGILLASSPSKPHLYGSISILSYFSTMVLFAPIIGAALLAGFTVAMPMPDSSVGDEKAVSAPNGTPITDTSMPM